MTWRQRIHIGTSGWHYGHWQPAFYPPDLEKDEFLSYYRSHLSTVEINNTFYSLLDEKTLLRWDEIVRHGFTFSAKASRYITHMKKLKDPREPIERFLNRVTVLGEKLGPVLFQLPPRWNLNFDRLEHFLSVLPDDYHYAFEFRDSSWWVQSIYDLLRRYQASFCIFHLAGKLSPLEVTCETVYVRLHGPEGAYQGCYDTTELSGWAGRMSGWARQNKEIFCYFDNDQNGYAVQNALELQQMIHD